jgi:hypothetical protein
VHAALAHPAQHEQSGRMRRCWCSSTHTWRSMRPTSLPCWLSALTKGGVPCKYSVHAKSPLHASAVWHLTANLLCLQCSHFLFASPTLQGAGASSARPGAPHANASDEVLQNLKPLLEQQASSEGAACLDSSPAAARNNLCWLVANGLEIQMRWV